MTIWDLLSKAIVQSEPLVSVTYTPAVSPGHRVLALGFDIRGRSQSKNYSVIRGAVRSKGSHGESLPCSLKGGQAFGAVLENRPRMGLTGDHR